MSCRWRSRRADAVEALRAIQSRQVGERALAGWIVRHRAARRPVAQCQRKVRCRRHPKRPAEDVGEAGLERAVLDFCAGQGEWIRPVPRGVKKMAARQRQISPRRMKLTLYKHYSL